MDRCPPGRYGISIVPTTSAAVSKNIDVYHEKFEYKPKSNDIDILREAMDRKERSGAETEEYDISSTKLTPSDVASKYIEYRYDFEAVNFDISGKNISKWTKSKVEQWGFYQWFGEYVSEYYDEIMSRLGDRDFQKLQTDWLTDISRLSVPEIGKKVLSSGTPDLLLAEVGYDEVEKGGAVFGDIDYTGPAEVPVVEVKAEFTSGDRDSEIQSQIEWAWLYQEIPRYELKLDLLALLEEHEIEQQYGEVLRDVLPRELGEHFGR